MPLMLMIEYVTSGHITDHITASQCGGWEKLYHPLSDTIPAPKMINYEFHNILIMSLVGKG